jgi:methyl-accepting chemotaxis protein
MSQSPRKNELIFIGIGFIPVIASLLGPILAIKESFYWIASLAIWALFTFVVLSRHSNARDPHDDGELESENERLRKELSNKSSKEGSSSDIFIMKRTAENEFRKARGEIEGQVTELRKQVNSLTSEIESAQSSLQQAVVQRGKNSEDLAKARAEIFSLKDRPEAERSTLELRGNQLEQHIADKDEEISSQQALLRRILDLVPTIEGHLHHVITLTEGSAIDIGDKVRYIYDKAQEHLADSNEISKQFSGGTSTDNIATSKSLSAVLNGSLSLLKDMTEMLNESSNLNIEYSKSIEAILKNTATINKITEDIQYISDLTNLLALNAAIEAARAGEHGRGFSVVAEEVRKLSDRTNQASNDITQTVGKVNDSVQAISNSLTANLEKTQNKKGAVDQAVNTLMSSARASTEVFSKLVESSVVSSESVAHNIDQIILSLQFQDITKQEIESAVLPLIQIRDLAGQMVNGGKSGGSRIATSAATPSKVAASHAKTSGVVAPLKAVPAAEKAPEGGLFEATQPVPAPVSRPTPPTPPTPPAKTEEAKESSAQSGDVLFF